MLRFSTEKDHTRLSALRSQPADGQSIVTSKVGTDYHENSVSEKTNKNKRILSTVLFAVGGLGLIAGCAFLILDLTMFMIAAFFIGGLSMFALPISNQYFQQSQADNAAASTTPQDENKPKLDEKLAQYLDKKPKKRQTQTPEPQEEEQSDSEEIDLTDEEFSDSCPPATEDDFEGVFGLDIGKAARYLKKKFK